MKKSKKSPPAGKFGLVFGLLGFEVLVFKKMAEPPSFLGDFDGVGIVSFLILIHIETMRFLKSAINPVMSMVRRSFDSTKLRLLLFKYHQK